jgi:hypothetical protein
MINVPKGREAKASGKTILSSKGKNARSFDNFLLPACRFHVSFFPATRFGFVKLRPAKIK